MIKTLSLATVAAATLAAGAAQAQTVSDYYPWNWVRGDEVYGSLKGGYTQAQDLNAGTGSENGFNGGWAANAAVGRYLNPNTRAEIELGYTKSKDDGATVAGDADAWTGMLNAYYEPFANCLVKPYVGAGVGIANVDFDGASDDTNFAYQAMAGVSYQINPTLAATAEYRYSNAINLDVGTPNSPDFQNHAGLVGLRAKF